MTLPDIPHKTKGSLDLSNTKSKHYVTSLLFQVAQQHEVFTTSKALARFPSRFPLVMKTVKRCGSWEVNKKEGKLIFYE